MANRTDTALFESSAAGAGLRNCDCTAVAALLLAAPLLAAIVLEDTSWAAIITSLTLVSALCTAMYELEHETSLRRAQQAARKRSDLLFRPIPSCAKHEGEGLCLIKPSKRTQPLAVASCFVLGIWMPPASAAVILSDSFDDGDVSDWVKTTNVPGSTFAVATPGTYVSPGYSLVTYLVPTQTVFDAHVRASLGFTALATGDHTIALDARSSLCNGCVISYDVLVDGNLLLRAPSAYAFQPVSIVLPGLAAGAHQITLGMHTTVAGSGGFYAYFDDVVITGPDAPFAQIPEPSGLELLGTGLAVLAAANVRRSRRGQRASVQPARVGSQAWVHEPVSTRQLT